MYKLFLTFRYLTRKKIVLFPILVVWLCVAMLIIVASIMGGFVDRVIQTNHDLYGDIVISNGGTSLGWSKYDEIKAALIKKFPDIQAATPVVQAFALIYLPDYKQTLPAVLVGVDPAERSQVSQFRESLFWQYQAPMEAAEDLSGQLPATKGQLLERAQRQMVAATQAAEQAGNALDGINNQQGNGKDPTLEPAWKAWAALPIFLVIGLLYVLARRPRTPWPAVFFIVAGLTVSIVGCCWPLIFPSEQIVAEDRLSRANDAVDRATRTEQFAEGLPDRTYGSRQDLIDALVPKVPSIKVPAEAAALQPQSAPAPQNGLIVGSRLGFYERDKRGNFRHPAFRDFERAIVSVFPASHRTGNVSTVDPVRQPFTIIDDSYTGVYDVDKVSIYADFETVQQMANFRPDPEVAKQNPDNPTVNFAPMCQQLLIRLKGAPTEEQTRELRSQIAEFVHQFQVDNPTMFPLDLSVKTWNEEQAQYLDAVKNEKTMMTLILGLMSLVVLVVIFLIFYQIVRDKTRDIGIIKAVGGSEEGVAGIFISYGLCVGLVGGALGVISGVAFVTHTNQIHEWIFRMTGITIWDRSVYLFDRIPDQVYGPEVARYFLIAVFAGLLGALIPAILAGRQDPVEAVRYE